jgi:hypothetical protein
MVKFLLWLSMLLTLAWAIIFFSVWATHANTTIEVPSLNKMTSGALLEKSFEGVYRDDAKKASVVIENDDLGHFTALFFLNTNCILTERIDESSFNAACYQSDNIKLKPVRAQFTIEQATMDTIYVTFYADDQAPIEYTFKKVRNLK